MMPQSVIIGLLLLIFCCSADVLNKRISVGELYDQLKNLTNDTVIELCGYDVTSLFGWSLYNVCKKECSRRKLDCDQTCPCRNGARCKPTMGVCECAPGWWGNFCQYPCEEGFYGNECNSRCQCNNNTNQLCDHVTGRCDERQNSINCRTDPYHGLCRGRCNNCPRDTVCSNTGSCTCPEPCTTTGLSSAYCPECHINGKICLTASGTWTGGICSQCNGVQNATCFPTCDEGWQGMFCRECRTGRYGPNCQNKCKCGEGAVCESTTGQCICAKGCSRRCRSGFYGPRCERRCDCPSGVPCTDDNGTCTCPVGKYGPMCLINCACPGGTECDVLSGVCQNCTDCEIEGSSNAVTVAGVFVGIAIGLLVMLAIAIVVRYKRIQILQLMKFEKADSVIQNSRPLSYLGETCSLAPGYRNRDPHYERSIQSYTLPPLPSPLLHDSSGYNTTSQTRSPMFTTTAPPSQPDIRLYEDPESIHSYYHTDTNNGKHGEEVEVSSKPEDDQGTDTGSAVINTVEQNENPQYFQLEKPV